MKARARFLPDLEAIRRQTQQSGTTLSEVLVSLLVMSIGVVSLASLFPISVIRSAQATKLTNAAQLKYNVEALTRILPNMVSIAPDWSEGTAYVSGDVRVAKAETRRKIPAAAYRCTGSGTSGTLEPEWEANELQTTTEVNGTGPVTWQTFRLKNYVIDPLGFQLTDPADANSSYRGTNLTGGKEHFGNVIANVSGTPSVVPFHTRINRFVGVNTSAIPTAQLDAIITQLATLPDSWNDLAESREPSYTGTSITSITLGGLSDSLIVPSSFLMPSPFTRVIIWDQDGKKSVIRYLTAVSGQTVSWTDPVSISSTFTPSRVRVEQLERRYTWMLSVRRGSGGSANVDCVISFRRPLTVADERVWPAVFRRIDYGPNGVPGGAGDDDDPSGSLSPAVVNWKTAPSGSAPFNEEPDAAELGWSGSDDKPRNWIIIQYKDADPDNPDPPYIKKGGFVCDVANLRWYRIIDVDDVQSTMAAATPTGFYTSLDDTHSDYNKFVRLTLERSIEADSYLRRPTVDANATPTTTPFMGGALLMRGVVDVFPLPTQLPWEE